MDTNEREQKATADGRRFTQIYADGSILERCLGLVLHSLGEGGCEADGRKTLIAAKERKTGTRMDQPPQCLPPLSGSRLAAAGL
jgi:hypothetical protein